MARYPLIFIMSLLLWGWQTGNLLIAISMAIVLEFARFSMYKWDITDKEFNRITDLTSITFLLFSIYQFNNQGVNGIFIIFANLPLIFFPLVSAQLYSEQSTIHLSSLFMSLRKKSLSINDYPDRLDLTFPYVITCVVSSTAGNLRTILFYLFICFILGYCLYFARPKRYRLINWLIILACTFVLGYLIQFSLVKTQAKIESMAGDILEQMFWRNRSPDKTNTAIGSIGRLKLSDQIHVRVKTNQKLTRPFLLHEAAYSVYGYGIWRNDNSVFTPIDPEISGREWNISEEPESYNSLTISAKLYEDKGVIPTPNGIFRLNNISAIDVDRNNLGTVRLENRPGWNTYDTHFNNNPYPYSAPDEDDLKINPLYQSLIQQISEDLQLHSMNPEQALLTIKNYFKNNFKYSLVQRYRTKDKTRMHDFMLHTHTGHCEYFATATTLLLRSAGIPSRYNVGYSIQEFSKLESQYVGRARDAHSWSTAYINGKWEIVDTTPSLWFEIETDNEPWWVAVTDIFSWIQFNYSKWQNNDNDEDKNYYIYIVLALIILLIWRLKVGKKTRISSVLLNKDKPGSEEQDSIIITLIKFIEKRHSGKKPGETLNDWIARLGISGGKYDLSQIINLYYRYKFDPHGIDKNDRTLLESKIKQYINQEDLPTYK